jgi:hypothetical protein
MEIEDLDAASKKADEIIQRTGKPIRILADCSGRKKHNVRIFGETVRILGTVQYKAVAVYVTDDNPLFGLISTIVETISRENPVKIFADRAEAEAWLRET